MKATVVLESDRGVFGLKIEEGDYAVISLDGSDEIDLRDTLSGIFDDSQGLFKSLRNVTKGRDVRICIETWGCNFQTALDFVKRLNSPTEVKGQRNP